MQTIELFLLCRALPSGYMNSSMIGLTMHHSFPNFPFKDTAARFFQFMVPFTTNFLIENGQSLYSYTLNLIIDRLRSMLMCVYVKTRSLRVRNECRVPSFFLLKHYTFSNNDKCTYTNVKMSNNWAIVSPNNGHFAPKVVHNWAIFETKCLFAGM